MKNENNNPRKSNIIGICVSQLQNHEVSGLTHTIYQCARANGYQVMVFGCFAKMDFPTPHSNGEASIFENIPMKDLKALILMGQTILHRELLQEKTVGKCRIRRKRIGKMQKRRESMWTLHQSGWNDGEVCRRAKENDGRKTGAREEKEVRSNG